MGFFPPSRRLVAGHFLDAKVQDNWGVVQVGSNIPPKSSSDFLKILPEEKCFMSFGGWLSSKPAVFFRPKFIKLSWMS